MDLSKLIAFQSAGCWETSSSGLAMLLTQCRLEEKSNCPNLLEFC